MRDLRGVFIYIQQQTKISSKMKQFISHAIGLAIIATIPTCAFICAYIAHDMGESYLCSALVFVTYAYAHYKTLDKVITIYENKLNK